MAEHARVAQQGPCGRQLLRFRLRPRTGFISMIVGAVLAALAGGAAFDAAWIACVVLGAAALTTFSLAAWGAGRATAAVSDTLLHLPEASTDADETPVETPEVSEVPEALTLPRLCRLPPLEHAQFPPDIAAQLPRADAAATRDRMEP